MSTKPIKYRSLAYTDLPQVIAVERRSFSTAWSLAMFVLELSKPSGVCLAALDGRTLVGYLVCSRYDEAWHLMNIAVDPTSRRHGIARGLLETLLDRAGRDAAYTLEVRTSNRPAIALYEDFGFRNAGTRPRYYADTGEDAIIMWRTTEAVARWFPSGKSSNGIAPGAIGDCGNGRAIPHDSRDRDELR
jgi:[ribosomal protein S18]-alanine N-acetyltransferase